MPTLIAGSKAMNSPIYGIPGTLYAYHGVVNHSAKEYVRDDDYTNTVEGYFSIVKRGHLRHLSARE